MADGVLLLWVQGVAHGHSYLSNDFEAGQPGQQFYRTTDDLHGVIAQYYETPRLSVRDVIWHDLRCVGPSDDMWTADWLCSCARWQEGTM